jgi:type IV secretory pathway VirB4 component
VPVKLTQDFRDRHVYVIGKSGAGKTNLLRNLIQQDLEAGNGLGVLAPEAEMLSEEIIPFIPDGRIDDVVYFNPADTDCPVCFNPLQVEDGEDIDLKVDENLTVFKRLMGETGPRMEEILRQALYALTGRPGSTLLDLEQLLDPTDTGFRSEVVSTCQDEAVAHYWQQVYPSLPKDAHLPITNRLGRLLRPKAIRSILCRPQGSISFQQAMDSGKVMLFNLSDGLLGEQNSQLLGQLVVSKFQLAVMARARQPKATRRNFYLYLDEFQTFVGTAGASYEKILSRARKYKLGLILAHQQTGQIGSDLLKEILGNVSTTVCFPVSREDALRFSKEFVTEYDGEVLNVPEEEILRLKVGQAWCRMGQHAFLMHTKLASQRPLSKRARYIIERARSNYGRALPPPSLDDSFSAAMPAGERLKAHEPLDDLDPGSVFGK